MTRVATSILRAPRGDASRWALFLHGILGSRGNLRSLARAFVSARAGWGAVLVDLRKHGQSQDLDPPHTVEAAANDLREIDLDAPVGAVIGHSFGGKVALAYAAAAPRELEEVWILDSNPGARPTARGSEATLEVLSTLEALPRRWPSREAFVERIVEAGRGELLGGWLAMNLEREGDDFELRLDLVAIRALLDDYFARDLWDVFESPPGDTEMHLVIGARSTVLDESDRQRAEEAARRSDRVHVHTLDAGHWLHVEAPDALAALLTAARR